MQPNQSKFHGLALLIIICILILMPTRLFSGIPMQTQWIMVLLLLTIFTLIAGHWITGVFYGAFVNDRNRMSLSQIQLVLWTLLVLGTYLSAVFINLSFSVAQPLEITIPGELWILMGISTTSLIGSPLLSSRKKGQKVDIHDEAKAMNVLSDQGRKPANLDANGGLIANKKPADAAWSELFEADEISRAGRLDISKIQMFFFTLIIALVYATALASSIASVDKTGFRAFPEIDESMIALLGISHAGFLTSRAVPERENV